MIGSGDLGELLSNWGACVGCCADLAPVGSGNGAVNAADLAELNANWGNCEESLMGGGDDEVPPALTSALETCGFEGPQDFLNWSESASTEDIDAMGYLLQALLTN